VLLDLPVDLIAMYLKAISEQLYREQYPALSGWYYFMAFARGFQKNPPPMPPFDETIPPWMRPDSRSGSGGPYSRAVVEAWRAAMRLGVASNYDLAYLGYRQLKQSGW
jgi:hypothetical protein